MREREIRECVQRHAKTDGMKACRNKPKNEKRGTGKSAAEKHNFMETMIMKKKINADAL